MHLPRLSKLTSTALRDLRSGVKTVERAAERAVTLPVHFAEKEVGFAADALADKVTSAEVELTQAVHPKRKLYSNADTQVAAADPGVIRVGKDYYLAHTGTGFPMLHSKDLVHWTPAGSIFPPGHRPKWAKGSNWAPEIHRVGKQYVAYYTARDASGMLRIGCATAKKVTGPYTDLGHPLVSNPKVGLIDPTYFQDANGTGYLIYKRDANGLHPPKPTQLMISRLSEDGTQRVGKPKAILKNTLPWEGPLVEAPELVKHGGAYYLFYSANSYGNDKYAVGVARAESPTGPFQKLPEPILRSGAHWKGPGHGSIVTGPDGHTWFVYHAWKAGHVGGKGNRRMLLVDRIDWKNGWPTIGDGRPSNGPRVAP